MAGISFGRWLYLFYHAPKGVVVKTLKNGVLQTIRTARGKKEMIAAACMLPEQTGLPRLEMTVTICFLTGAKYYEQTLFCLHSLQHWAGVKLPVVIYSDGTLTIQQINEMIRITGCNYFVVEGTASKRLLNSVPIQDNQALHQRRGEYPHLKKLTDIHAGQSGWRLVLDSDMIFYSKPTELLEWCANPTTPLHMVDSETSYGYDKNLMEKLCGNSVAEKVNVGIIGLKSDDIDWSKVNHWIEELQRQAGTSYFQEQALAAMILASSQAKQLDAEAYKCLPTDADLNHTVCAHYVAESKNLYFQKAWRLYLEKIQ